jgi:hypothetical protein
MVYRFLDSRQVAEVPGGPVEYAVIVWGERASGERVSGERADEEKAQGTKPTADPTQAELVVADARAHKITVEYRVILEGQTPEELSLARSRCAAWVSEDFHRLCRPALGQINVGAMRFAPLEDEEDED